MNNIIKNIGKILISIILIFILIIQAPAMIVDFFGIFDTDLHIFLILVGLVSSYVSVFLIFRKEITND